jgi:hypothetical protein
VADLGTTATDSRELTLTVLGVDGKPRPELDGQVLAAGRPQSFLACGELGGLLLRWAAGGETAGGQEPQHLRLFFAGVSLTDTWNSWLRAPQLPPVGAFHLDECPDAAVERRFPVNLTPAAQDAPYRDGTLIELALAPAAAGEARLRFPAGPWLLQRVELAAAPYQGEPLRTPPCAEREHYPLPRPHLPPAGDPLAAELAALTADTPTVEQVWRLALPFRGGALLGAVEGPVISQLWDGGLVWPERSGAYSRLWLRIGLPAAELQQAEQRLHEGYLPIAESRLQALTQDGAITLSQTALIDLQGALQLQIVARGPGVAPDPALLCHATRAGLVKSINQPRAQACIYEPLPAALTADSLRLGDTVTAVSRTALPGGAVQLELRLPLSSGLPAAPAPSFATAYAEVKAEAEQFLAAGAQLELPDPHLHNAWRALLLHNRLFQREGILRYGLFPGVYDGGLFGVEEGWNIVAMAQYGHPRRARALLERTFFAPEFLKKEGQHHQYRAGLCITYARDVHALGGEPAALRALWPLIAENAEWIAAAFRSTQRLDESGGRPVHYGLLPKHTYGGDLTEPTYSLYGSSAAWRGLRDAALLAKEVGDPRAAAWAQAATETRQNLLITAERIYKSAATPPFLPFRTDEPGQSPSAGDYHQLFASLILETALFGWQGRWARSITDYLQQTGRQTLGVARFDQWFGRLGVDAEYSRGMQLCALHRREFDRFYLGLLGQIGLSCDPHTFVSPETAIVLFSRQEYADRLRTVAEQPARPDSDPCSAGTAVMLQYLRYLLALEERDEDDLPTGTLWIGAGAPAAWFAPGQSFAARELPTSLGTVSLRCHSTVTTVTYELVARPDPAAPPLPVEVFYFDADGRRRSRRALVSGCQTLQLPRRE